ncbi:cupin domain-containing protein [Bordetella avium]|uniref:cupin domain-containing protein n=1 Tax=Bordetella avium TaxID=521 RepID=UPI000FD751A0|nr:cupin domain-containing protein [Bordetella avium]AZY48954.1 cupin domain-containing protein [Bordetella avium]
MIKTESQAVLLQLAHIKMHDRGGGARTQPLVGKAVGATAFITGYTEFGGGAEIPFHQHNAEESVVLIEGSAIFDIDGQSIPVQQGDATFIPPNVPHRFRNASATAPMKILWIYGSVEADRTLVATGETRPIAAEHNT